MTTPSSFDFGQLYGQADNSNIRYPEGTYDAVVEDASWGRTKDGTKGQWTIKDRTTTGELAGKMPLTQTITVSHDNPRALGIMFRHLAALGIPVPDPRNPNVCVNGDRPFWVMGWTPEMVAQAMVGKPHQISVKDDEYDGVTRSKIKDWRPARPGAPTTWPRADQPQPGFGGGPGFQPGQPAAAPQWQQPQGQGQQAPAPFQQPAFPGQQYDAGQQAPAPWAAQQPAYPGQQPQQGQPWEQPQVQQPAPYQPAQQPWQGQQQQPPPQQYQNPAQPQFGGQVVPQGQDYTAQQQQQPQQGNPAAPPWAQPPQPGQGGVGEFTQQGMSQQPSFMQPQQGQPGPQQPQAAPPQQAVPQPPWQQQAPAPPQQGWNGGQPAQPQQQPGDVPPPPPWGA